MKALLTITLLFVCLGCDSEISPQTKTNDKDLQSTINMAKEAYKLGVTSAIDGYINLENKKLRTGEEYTPEDIRKWANKVSGVNLDTIGGFWK